MNGEVLRSVAADARESLQFPRMRVALLGKASLRATFPNPGSWILGICGSFQAPARSLWGGNILDPKVDNLLVRSISFG